MASTGVDTGVMHPDMEKTATRLSHSNVPPPELLAGNADTELLGQYLQFPRIRNLLTEGYSETWLQARASPQLYNDRSLWHRLQYHGLASIHRIDTRIFDPSWACGHGMGLVRSIDVHLHRWCSDGRSR